MKKYFPLWCSQVFGFDLPSTVGLLFLAMSKILLELALNVPETKFCTKIRQTYHKFCLFSMPLGLTLPWTLLMTCLILPTAQSSGLLWIIPSRWHTSIPYPDYPPQFAWQCISSTVSSICMVCLNILYQTGVFSLLLDSGKLFVF